jgi:hypothetical protein
MFASEKKRFTYKTYSCFMRTKQRHTAGAIGYKPHCRAMAQAVMRVPHELETATLRTAVAFHLLALLWPLPEPKAKQKSGFKKIITT